MYIALFSASFDGFGLSLSLPLLFCRLFHLHSLTHSFCLSIYLSINLIVSLLNTVIIKYGIKLGNDEELHFIKHTLFTLSLNQYTRCYCQLNFVDVVTESSLCLVVRSFVSSDLLAYYSVMVFAVTTVFVAVLFFGFLVVLLSVLLLLFLLLLLFGIFMILK